MTAAAPKAAANPLLTTWKTPFGAPTFRDFKAGHFLPAFEVCLPVTIHAGEGQEADRIWQAAYHLHADRIGHGLTIGDHPELAKRFRDRSICIELCPSSNLEIVGFRESCDPTRDPRPVYPLTKLWAQGLPIAICTDNPGISRTTLAGEFLQAARLAAAGAGPGDGLTCWDALAIMKQGFAHAFLSSDEREKLLKQADALIYETLRDASPNGDGGLVPSAPPRFFHPKGA